jgi:hypothetical protein
MSQEKLQTNTQNQGQNSTQVNLVERERQIESERIENIEFHCIICNKKFPYKNYHYCKSRTNYVKINATLVDY